MLQHEHTLIPISVLAVPPPFFTVLLQFSPSPYTAVASTVTVIVCSVPLDPSMVGVVNLQYAHWSVVAARLAVNVWPGVAVPVMVVVPVDRSGVACDDANDFISSLYSFSPAAAALVQLVAGVETHAEMPVVAFEVLTTLMPSACVMVLAVFRAFEPRAQVV